MRPLEWLVLLSIVPFLLHPLFPERWRRRQAAWVLGVLPSLSALIQIAFEGWRVQMLPLYFLTFVALLLHRRQPQPWICASLTVLTAAAALLPAWVLPVLHLPSPSGPYNVGVTDRVVPAEGGRRLMTTVWYPTSAAAGLAPLTHHPAQIAAGLGRAFGMPGAAPLLQHLRYITVHATTDAPVQAQAFPVVVFSPGMTGLRLQNSETFQELASHGYVVVALDHTDAAAVTVFPDGEVRPFDLSRFGIRPDQVQQSNALLLPHWMRDQRRVYDALAEWNQTDPLLARRLDLSRIGSLGHSFGGVTAVEWCRLDPRCRAAANLDGGWATTMPPHGTTKPLLLISAQASSGLPVAMRHWALLMQRSAGHPLWLELPNSNHVSFTLIPRLSPLLSPRHYQADAGQREINRALRTFFASAFKGESARFSAEAAQWTDMPIRFPEP